MVIQVMAQPLCSSPLLGTGALQAGMDAPRPSRLHGPAVRDTHWVCLVCLRYEVSSPGTGTERSHTAGCRYTVVISCMRPCWQIGHTAPGSTAAPSGGLRGSVAKLFFREFGSL